MEECASRIEESQRHEGAGSPEAPDIICQVIRGVVLVALRLCLDGFVEEGNRSYAEGRHGDDEPVVGVPANRGAQNVPGIPEKKLRELQGEGTLCRTFFLRLVLSFSGCWG